MELSKISCYDSEIEYPGGNNSCDGGDIWEETNDNVYHLQSDSFWFCFLNILFQINTYLRSNIINDKNI